MRRDKIYQELDFSTEFSVEDWNALIKLKLGKYFNSDHIFEKNKELLRTEIINYIRFSEKPEYFSLFEWTFNLYKDCLSIDKEQTIKIIAASFNVTSNTDMVWISNVLTQPDSTTFSERDKISYYFKIIDETLEGAFKPRFKLLARLANFKLNQTIVDNSNYDFGRLVKDFPNQLKNEMSLFIEDPIYSISTNQWRNIAAHKSFLINKENIAVEYGRTNIQKITITFNEFDKIVIWTQDIYRVIRLAQVLTDLNYTEEIISELGGIANISVRFESSLLHIIHNMQIVGFGFDSTEEQSDTFCLNVRGKANHDIKSSLIHASQCLDRISCAIYEDKFVSNKFTKTQICIVDENRNKLGSATIAIETALLKVNNQISLKKYLDNMKFEIKSC